MDQGPIFRTFFPGKISGKIPRKIFPQKMLGKNVIFRGKSFEKSFFKEIPRNFPRKGIFRGKGFSAEKMYEKSPPDVENSTNLVTMTGCFTVKKDLVSIGPIHIGLGYFLKLFSHFQTHAQTNQFKIYFYIQVISL
jgi:hypothetical protein